MIGLRSFAHARAWLALGVMLALSVLTGCGVKPLGTNDVAVAFRAEGADAPKGDALGALVRARLAAAQITADVETGGAIVTLTLDRDEAEDANDLLTWRGGVELWNSEADAKTHDAKPRVDLRDGIAAVSSPDGRSLALHLTTAGARRVEDAKGASVVVARDRVPLATVTLASDPILVPLGDDLAAYARARALRLLLSSPTLPALVRVSSTPVPVNLPLATAALGLPFVLSLAWLFFVRRFDRAHPEPWPLVAATFALGCFAIVPALCVEIGWTHVSQWTDPSLVTMGGRIASLPFALATFTVVIGLSEEGAKFLGAWSLSFHRKEFDEPIDGIVYGAASALGFAAVENVKYFAVGRFEPSLVVLRTFLSIPAHLFFSAIWGYALGQKLVRPRTRVLAYVAGAAVAHGAFDAFLSIDGLASLALALNLALASLFVVFLRRALRHGVVSAASKKVDPAKRFIVPVGSIPGFAASIGALLVLVALLFYGSTIAEEEHVRADVPLLSAMALLVVLLGLAALALARTMPLDVVIDEYGVTYAGAALAWKSIRSVVRSPRGLRLRSSTGDVWIGPGDEKVMEAIGRAIMARVGSR